MTFVLRDSRGLPEVASSGQKLGEGDWPGEIGELFSECLRRKEVCAKPSITRAQLLLQLVAGHDRVDTGDPLVRDEAEEALTELQRTAESSAASVISMITQRAWRPEGDFL
jgi:hypothetical protein